MSSHQAENLIKNYQDVAKAKGLPPIISEIYDRWQQVPSPSCSKANRWLGFCQGYLVAVGVYTLDEVRIHTSVAEAT